MKGVSAGTEAGGAAGAGEAARLGRAASRKLAMLSEEQRNQALELAAERLEENEGQIVAANAEDVRAAEPLVPAGKLTRAALARLRVTEKGVAEMAEKVRSVVRLPDPLGRRLSAMELDEGLVLTKETCPLGVVAVVFESRPDVVPQVASLALTPASELQNRTRDVVGEIIDCLVVLVAPQTEIIGHAGYTGKR